MQVPVQAEGVEDQAVRELRILNFDVKKRQFDEGNFGECVSPHDAHNPALKERNTYSLGQHPRVIKNFELLIMNFELRKPE